MDGSFAPRFSRVQLVLLAVVVTGLLAGAGFITWKAVSGGDSSAHDHVLAQYVVSLSESSMTVAPTDAPDAATTTALPIDFDAMIVGDQGRWLLEDNRDNVVNYFDLMASPPVLHSVELPFAGFSIHRKTVRVGNDLVLLFSLDGSLGLAVVDLVDGTAYPIASARGKYFEAGSVRDYLLFREVDGLKTVIVPVADPTAFWTVQGAVVDVRGMTTLIATVDGLASYVTVYEGLKRVGVRVQVENPIMGGMLTDTGAVVLERTGAISVIDNVTGKVKRAGVSEFGAQGALPVADDRLYGWGGEGSAIVDPDGAPLSSYPLGTTDTGERRPLVATAGGSEEGCLVLQPGAQVKPVGAGGVLISIADGAELATLDASPSWVSPDGCTLVGLDSQVVIDGKPVDIDLDQVFSVAPDRGSVLGMRRSVDGEATFVLLDVATGATSELNSGFNLFAMF